MKYRSVVATRLGSPKVLEIAENDLREPEKGEVRIRVLAAGVSRPDITVRRGEALYTGTPLGQKVPFVPGYSIIGTVDAVGEGVTGEWVGSRVGALMVVGGYGEVVYWKANRLIPVPETVDPAEAVTLILNYIVAYQVMHRAAKVKKGGSALIIGASGGIGTALLELGRLAGLKMYGIASKSKQEIVTEYGAIPIDYKTQNFVEVIREAEPGGIDCVFDGMMTVDYIRPAYSLLKRGGRMVSFGEPPGFSTLFRVLGQFFGSHLLPDGRRYRPYGTSGSIFNWRPFLKDWAALFGLLEAGKIKPVIAAKFPILEAAKANELLESGTVIGNIVLVSPELL